MPSMQTDVLATKPLTSTGDFKDQNDNDIPRTRIKTIYAVCGGTAGSVVIREGGSGGDIVITVNTPPVDDSGYVMIPMPGQGILVKTGNLHGTITNTASVVVIYG